MSPFCCCFLLKITACYQGLAAEVTNSWQDSLPALVCTTFYAQHQEGLGQNRGIWHLSAEAGTDSQAEQLLLADTNISPVLARPVIHSYGFIVMVVVGIHWEKRRCKMKLLKLVGILEAAQTLPNHSGCLAS